MRKPATYICDQGCCEVLIHGGGYSLRIVVNGNETNVAEIAERIGIKRQALHARLAGKRCLKASRNVPFRVRHERVHFGWEKEEKSPHGDGVRPFKWAGYCG